MKIAFILVGNESRKGALTGYNIRYGGASASGTETSAIYLAEYFSSLGYKTTIALEKCEEPIESNGVLYTDLNFTGDTDLEYDIIISCLWFKDYVSLPIKVNKAFIYWCHLAWGYAYNEIADYVKRNNLRFGLVSISKWAYQHNSEISDIIRRKEIETIDTIIPNSVAVDVIKEVIENPPQRKPRKFIHHGQWSRGGDTAYRAFKSLNWEDSEFVSFDYINRDGGLDKKTLFNEIANSEYFIYPQITHGRLVYKDTFSVSIAEAIGLGATVITYPLGAVPEYFGEYCQFLDYPPGVDLDKMNGERLSEEPRLDYVDNILDKINWLEDNPHIKEEVRKKGIEYIIKNFDISVVGLMWNDYLKKF